MTATYLSMSVFQEPNWIITTTIGAVLGALVASYGKVITYPVRRLKKDALEGEWHEYHYSYLGNATVLRKCRLSIKKGLMQSQVAHFIHPSSSATPELRYTGTIKREGGHLVLNLHATTHEETLTYRFTSQIPSNNDVVPGIWLSYDHDLRPASGAAILSRIELTENEATALLKARVTVGASGVLRIT